MARRAVTDRKKRIMDHLAKMLVQHLSQHVFPGKTLDEIARRLSLSTSIFTATWWQDVPDICEGAGLDIGLIIRDQKGNEVTLWPAENFATGVKPRLIAGKKHVVEPSHRTRAVGFAAGGTQHHSKR